jgi:hypothetical protein
MINSHFLKQKKEMSLHSPIEAKVRTFQRVHLGKIGKDQRSLFSKREAKGKMPHTFLANVIFTFSGLIPLKQSKAGGAKILHFRLETSMYTKPSWSTADACLPAE